MKILFDTVYIKKKMTYFIFKRIVAVTNTSNVRIIVYHFRVRGLCSFL